MERMEFDEQACFFRYNGKEEKLGTSAGEKVDLLVER